MVCDAVDIFSRSFVLQDLPCKGLQRRQGVIKDHQLDPWVVLAKGGTQVVGYKVGLNLGRLIHRGPQARGCQRLVLHSESPHANILSLVGVDELREVKCPRFHRLLIRGEEPSQVAITLGVFLCTLRSRLRDWPAADPVSICRPAFRPVRDLRARHCVLIRIRHANTRWVHACFVKLTLEVLVLIPERGRPAARKELQRLAGGHSSRLRRLDHSHLVVRAARDLWCAVVPQAEVLKIIVTCDVVVGVIHAGAVASVHVDPSHSEANTLLAKVLTDPLSLSRWLKILIIVSSCVCECTTKSKNCLIGRVEAHIQLHVPFAFLRL
mmetsp:Transcript_137414/g.293664  ORF Transcript_137414/g.293664 Transcript_137414/m.293664 type:complete len:323 (-) Transcript_137414:520-1488(-)